MSVTMLSPNTLMEEANLHASLHHEEGSHDFYMEVIHYCYRRVDHEAALQVCRLMVVLYQLPVTDEQIDLIADYVRSRED